MTVASRFFRCDPAAYESTRLTLDAVQQMPPGETTYAPLALAPTDAAGNPLLAIREIHCAAEPYRQWITTALDRGDMVEITEAEYLSVLPEDGP